MCLNRLWLILPLIYGLASHSVAQTNLVVNGDFEDGLNSWTWTGDGVSNVASLSMDTPSGTGNSADLDINEVLGLPWLIQDVPVEVGEELTFTATVREVRQFLPTFDAWIAAQIYMLPNPDSGTILSYNFTTFTDPNWETKSFDITVPDGATIARILFTPQDPDFGVGTGQYRVDDVSLTADPSLLGDYNSDGSVDAADYVKWRDTLDSTTDLAADGDNSGTIDLPDYEIWKGNFGAGGASGGLSLGAGSAVPEPASYLLVGVMSSLLLIYRR